MNQKNTPQTNISVETKPQTNTPTTNTPTTNTPTTNQPSTDNSNLSKSGNTPKTTTTTSGPQGNVNDWTNEEQSALEIALRKFPSSLGTERWDKIAESIPTRTKKECVLRYKFLVSIVKKSKE